MTRNIVQFPAEAQISLFFRVHTAFTGPAVEWTPGDLSPGLKQPGLEVLLHLDLK